MTLNKKNSDTTKLTIKSLCLRKIIPTDELHDEFNLHKVYDITKQEILTFVINLFLGSLLIIFKN